MSSLDDKLREIIAAENRHSDKTHRYDMDGLIAQIKQAFADAGWYRSPLVNHQMKRIESGQLMTGQEFYDRFEKELPRRLLSDVDCIRAAHRAAGLKENTDD